MSYAYADAADFAAGGVPTVSDEYGNPYDYVDHATRLLSTAQDVMARAVIYARERGGTWSDIAEALDATDQQAQERYAETVEHWEDALNRPWERSGRFLLSMMPSGTAEPDESAAYLDEWCARHLEPNSGVRHNARHDGIEDRMVSANLPKQTPVTEITSLTRTASYLVQCGSDATDSERGAYAARKMALLAKYGQTDGGGEVVR